MCTTNVDKWPVEGGRSVVRHRFAAEAIGCRVSRMGRGRIGAVFKHASIVLLDDGGIIALLAPHVGQVAHGVRLAESRPFDRWVSIGMPARVCGDYISLGDGIVAVMLSTARIWTPAIHSGLLKATETTLKAVVLLRKLLLTLAFAAGSEFLALTLSIARPATVLEARVSTTLAALAPAARAHDSAGCLVCLRDLVGLGPGLTPAGDDFIIGWLAGLTVAAQSPDQREFLAAMRSGIAALSGGTTPISRQHLADACALMFSERLSDVCLALASGAPRAALETCLAAQMSVGATSGADAAAGLIFALCDCAPSLRVTA